MADYRPRRKEERVCPLCGKLFYSNARRFCVKEHIDLWRHMKRGTNASTTVLELLIKREGIGVMLHGYWLQTLCDIGWIEETEDAGWWKLSDWGKQSLSKMKASPTGKGNSVKI